MKWEVTYERGAFKELDSRKKGLPLIAHYIMYDSVEIGLVQEILDGLKGKPEPHELWIFDPYYNITVISSVNYKKREIAIYDVKNGDKR